jgi:hypothetical protein
VTQRSPPLWHRGTERWWVLLLVCLCAAFLVACRRDGDSARATPTAEPTLFVATASPAGIANPPQTARPATETATRGRAEAFLRRVALTDADLPLGMGDTETTLRDAAALAALDMDPAASQARLQRAGFVLSAETRAENPRPTSLPADGLIYRLSHTAYAFTRPDGATPWSYLPAGPASLPIRAGQLLSGRAASVRVEAVNDLRLGDETLAWRAQGAALGTPGLELVGWAIDVRRGAGSFLLLVDGAGPAVDRFARDLAARLDQRMAAVQPSSWP